MSRRRQSAAEYARDHGRQERDGIGGHGDPESDAHNLHVGKVPVLHVDLALERIIHRIVGVRLLAQKSHETEAACEPREYLEEAVEPERTLYAALLQAHHEKERDESEHAENKGEQERHGVDQMQMVVHDVGRLEFVGECLRQVFEALFLDELGRLEVEVGAEAFVSVVVLILAEYERAGRVDAARGTQLLVE